jgi:hypothetical protein
MKKVIVVFPRERYVSDQDGLSQSTPMVPALMEALGGGTTARWEVTVYARSSSQARLDLSIFEGTKKDARPSANKFSGTALPSTPLAVSALGVTNLQANGPFHGLLDATLAMKSAAPVAGTQEWMDAEVRVTLDMD